MNHTQLLKATLDARKRGLQGASLSALLLVLDEPVPLGKLAKRIGITNEAMTGMADRLYLKGYATRDWVKGDRRSWALKITPKGLAAVEEILNSSN